MDLSYLGLPWVGAGSTVWSCSIMVTHLIFLVGKASVDWLKKTHGGGNRDLWRNWNRLKGKHMNIRAWALSATKPDKERKPTIEQHDKDDKKHGPSLF